MPRHRIKVVTVMLDGIPTVVLLILDEQGNEIALIRESDALPLLLAQSTQIEGL